jgi:hypothetical protein
LANILLHEVVVLAVVITIVVSMVMSIASHRFVIIVTFVAIMAVDGGGHFLCGAGVHSCE